MGALFCLVFILFTRAYGGGGSGGPIGVAFTADDISSVNSYLSALDIPAFDNVTYMIGGTGVNLLTKSVGIGGLITVGSQFRNKSNRYATLTLVNAGLPIQYIFHEDKKTQYTFTYGPGYAYLGLSINDGVNEYEFNIASMMFIIALTAQFKISEFLRLEVQLGMNSIAKNEWKITAGPEGTPLPEKSDISGIYGAFALRFGGRDESMLATYIPMNGHL